MLLLALFVLLVSLSSLTTLLTSAVAKTQYVPGAVPDGIVTSAVPVLVAPAFKTLSDRVSVSGISSESPNVLFGDIT
jgi:hypothetical protein